MQITAVAFQVAPEFTGWHAAVLQQLAGSYEALVGPAAAAQEALKAVPAALAGHPSLAGMPEAKLRAQVPYPASGLQHLYGRLCARTLPPAVCTTPAYSCAHDPLNATPQHVTNYSPHCLKACDKGTFPKAVHLQIPCWMCAILYTPLS